MVSGSARGRPLRRRRRAQTEGGVLSLVRFVVAMGTVLALIGFAQFVTGINIVNALHIPGLTLHSSGVSLYDREGFHRVNGTALHALEYATVLSMVLPLALSQAVRRRTSWCRAPGPAHRRSAAADRVPVGRPGARRRAGLRTRRRGPAGAWIVLALLPVGVLAFVAVTPGLLGTIRGLFVSAGTDTSITARTDDYPAVGDFFSQYPWLGRGPNTFLPSIYRTLDNQYLGSLVEGGIVGLLCMVVLLLGTALLALRVARRLPAGPRPGALPRPGGLPRGGPGALISPTFDAYSFPMCMGMSLPPGGAGRSRRHGPSSSLRAPAGAATAGRTTPARHTSDPDRAARRSGPRDRRSGCSGRAARVRRRGNAGPRRSAARRSEHLLRKTRHDGRLIVVYAVMTDTRVRSRLAAEGHGDYEVAIGSGSLAPHTDVTGFGDVLRVGAVADDPRRASETATAVVREIGATLARLQGTEGIPDVLKVTVVESTEPQVAVLAVHPPLGIAAARVPGRAARWPSRPHGADDASRPHCRQRCELSRLAGVGTRRAGRRRRSARYGDGLFSTAAPRDAASGPTHSSPFPTRLRPRRACRRCVPWTVAPTTTTASRMASRPTSGSSRSGSGSRACSILRTSRRTGPPASTPTSN